MKKTFSVVIAFMLSVSMLITPALPAFAGSGTAAAESSCICEMPCKEGAVNEDCPVCSQDPAQCMGELSEESPASAADTTDDAAADENSVDVNEPEQAGAEDAEKIPEEEAADAAADAAEIPAEEILAKAADDEQTGRVPAVAEIVYKGDEILRSYALTINGRKADENNLYNVKTAQGVTYTVAISNEDNYPLSDVVRIYFDYSGTGFSAGSFPVSEKPYTLRNSNGSEYTMWVKPCLDEDGNEMPGKFYYELTGIKNGETLAFQNDVLYRSPSSAGGTMKGWIVAMSSEEAAEKDGQYIAPEKYVEINWDTDPVPFSIDKTTATSINSTAVKPHFEGDGNGGDTVYLKGLAYKIVESYNGSSGKSEGEDLVREVEYSDTMTLPASVFWADGVLEAIENGDYRVTGETVPSAYTSGYYGWSIYVTVDGKETKLVSVQNRNYQQSGNYKTNGIKNLTPSVVTGEDGTKQLQLTWHCDNPQKTEDAASSEYPARSFSVVYGDTVIAGSLEELNQKLDNKETIAITNKVDETRQYSWSEEQVSSDTEESPIDLEASLETAKYWLYYNNNGTDLYGGTDTPCVLYMRNTGIANLKDWGTKDKSGNQQPMITDTMTNTFYIKPENIEQMFKDTVRVGDTEYPVGDWLTMTVTNVSFFTVDEGNETAYGQELFAEDGPNKYTNGLPSSDNTELTRSATINYQKIDGKVVMTIANSGTAGKDGTYTIGDGGDFATLDAAYKALGIMITRNTAFKVEYQPGEGELVLKSGQIFPIVVPLTMKTTYMMLDGDSESYYGNNDISSYNYATFRAHYADKDQETKRQTNRLDWHREAFLYKNGYVASTKTTISGADAKVDDGNVIDYNVYFYQSHQSAVSRYYDYTSKSYKTLPVTLYPDLSYEKMPVSDLVTGAQVVLAPKDLNPDLTAPDGSALPVYTDSLGLTYWELNVPGTYSNLTFGTNNRVKDTSGSYSYRKADTIIVTRNADKSLSTLIKWEPLENWGGRQSQSSSGSGTTNIWYKVLVSGEESGMVTGGDASGQSFPVKNKCWQGDHQRHRLYDTLNARYTIYSFGKYIAVGEKDGTDTTAGKTLIKSNRIRKGDVMTYQIDIHNDSQAETVLDGSCLYDALPNNRSTFEWSKDAAAGERVENLRYVTTNATVQVAGEDGVLDTWEGQADGKWSNGIGDNYWSIEDKPATGTAATGQQYIRWDKNFQLVLKPGGSVKILVDLVFCDEESGHVWAQYVDKNNGQLLFNRFYLKEQGAWKNDWVTHLPIADGKAVLRKGVYDTGITKRRGSGSSIYYGHQYISRQDRKTYVNSGQTQENSSNLQASTVTYYTELYNGSNERLYLEPLQDQLPKGFTFNSMVNLNYHNTTDWDSYSDSYSFPGYCGINRRPSAKNIYTENGGYSDSNRLATVDTSIDETDSHKPVYVNAYIKSSVETIEGKQHVTFTFAGSGTNYTNNPALGYDAEVGRYYLDPGQAVRFGYNVTPGRYSETEDTAINTIGMPYYNYYNTGFEMDDYEKLKPSTANKLAPNDGICEQMTNEEVSKAYDFDTSAYEGKDAYNTEEDGNWLVSSVAVTREEMVPGIQKSVGGSTMVITNPSDTTIQGSLGSSGNLYGTSYAGGLKTSDIVNWRVRVFADENTMTDYTIVDTADAPYLFTGQVFYNGYHMSGTSTIRETDSNYLFTIGSRKEGDETVRIAAGSSLGSAQTIRIGKAEDDSDDQWFSFGSAISGDTGRVKIEKLEDGREQMTIELTGEKHSVAADSFLDFCIHTQFCKDVIVISDGKYNDAVVVPKDDYRTGAVTKGKALSHTEIKDGKLVPVNDGVQNGASVMLVQGYTTNSYKTVTSLEKPSDSASSEGSSNYILLNEKEDRFRYDLYVTGPKAVMSRIAIIDALPEEGDHSAFVQSDKRNSDFTVSLMDDPDVHVYLKKKNGTEKELPKDAYTLEGSTKTSFNSKDWTDIGDGWIDLSSLTPEEMQKIRSIRVVIEDEDAWQSVDTSLYKMPDETVIHVSFNAHIDDPEAAAGEYAWNSFGYHYIVPQNFDTAPSQRIGVPLMSQPLNVGVRFPAAPELTKSLVDSQGEPHEASHDLTFNFLIYKGEKIDALDDALTMDEADIAAALDRAERDYIVVPMTVKKGDTSATVDFWKKDIALAGYDNGWTEKEGVMHWDEGETYNVVELPLGAYNYTFKSINGKHNNFTFNQTKKQVISLEAVNAVQDEKMEVRGQKVWNDSDDQDGVRPESITINLLADDEVIDRKQVTAEDDWAWSFTDLPRYRETGGEVDYSIEELPVDGYETEITSETLDPEQPEETDSDAVDAHTIAFTVTNTHIPETTAVSIAKEWDDKDDQDGIRPAEITFHLLADGKEVASGKTSAKNGWKLIFQGFPVYKDHGSKIIYTVVEDEVKDYIAVYEQKSDTEWDVTNTHTPKEEPTPPAAEKKEHGPGTGDPFAPALAVLLMTAAAATAVLARRRKTTRR